MESRKNEVSRERSVYGKTCCFLVANFSDHNNIWILSYYCSKALSKRQICFCINLNLAYSFNIIFNRILNCRDMHFSSSLAMSATWNAGMYTSSEISEAIDAQRQRQPMSYRPLYGEVE
mgnify:CR=1 FL=1